MISSSDAFHIREPLLAFHGGQRHQDVRFGLTDFGPVDADPDNPRVVNLGIVGNSSTTDGLRRWLTRCEDGIPAKKSNKPNLFPAFPGSGPGGPFRCRFRVEERDVVAIPTSTIQRITQEQDDGIAVATALDVFFAEIEALSQRDNPPNVIVCALPLEVIERVKNMRAAQPAGTGQPEPATGDRQEDNAEEESPPVRDFRAALKARTLALRVPIQLVWPTTYDDNALIKRKLAKLSDRTVQDEATRAWNLFCGLYYKAGGTPWRIVRDPKAYTTAYIGVSFYENVDRTALMTSSAQLFDERGEGLVLQGGQALQDKDDRLPYLSSADAHDLLLRALTSYRREHGNFPARLVMYKSSRFHAEERDGFARALSECHIDYADFVWLPRRCPVRLYRPGLYPPLRGTALSLGGDDAVFYTRGSVDFFHTYTGLYVPNPLWVRVQRRDTASFEQILTELLTLTKMNWNATQFDNALPITLKAARQVGDVLKHVAEGQRVDPRYRFYM